MQFSHTQRSLSLVVCCCLQAAPRSSSVVLRNAANSLARVSPGSPSAMPTSRKLTGSPFEQDLAKAVLSQVSTTVM